MRLLPLVTLCPLLLPLATGCSIKAGHVRPRDPVLSSPADRALPTPSPWRGLLDDPGLEGGPALDAQRARLAEAAGTFVGKGRVVVGQKPFRADCSGTVRGIYAAAGVPLGRAPAVAGQSDTANLYRYVQQHGSIRTADPAVGDLIFFDHTYDRNKDGKANDAFSHIGVVERVLDDGTVVFVHRVSGRILRYRMNLARPHVRRTPEGQRVNHLLRRKHGSIPEATTAELFVAYGSLPAAPAATVASR